MSSTHRAQQTWGWASTWQSPHALPPAGEQPDGLSIYRSIAIGAADSTSTTNGRTLALCAPFAVHTTFPPRLGDEEHAFLAIPANGRCVPGIGVRLTQSSARSTRYVPSFHPLHLQPVYCPRHPLQALRAAVPVPVPVPAPVHNSSTFVCVCVCGCVCVCVQPASPATCRCRCVQTLHGRVGTVDGRVWALTPKSPHKRAGRMVST